MNNKNITTLGNYLSLVNQAYDPNQSVTDILNNFRTMSTNYSEFSNKTINTNNIKYSSNNYNECTDDEKIDFFNDQLQFIECLVTNNIYEKQGIVWNWFDIYKLLFDESYKNTDKIHRKVVYSTSGNNRPIGDTSYTIWNGMQIIDLDIKDQELSSKLKTILFNELNKYHWFLGVCKSASGKGLHIWTKITPIAVESVNRKIEFICNFRHKYSYVYIVLAKYSNSLGYTKEKIIDFMDMAMAKPQQGIFISSDNTAYLNTNFKDYRLDVNFESAFVSGVESINWISHPELKEIFHKLEWFNTDGDNQTNIEVSNISGMNDRDLKKRKGRQHYKHNQRWQLANTLTSIYGADKALEIMCEICLGTPTRELAGDVKTASIHNKPISLWAVHELNNQHGFNLKIKSDDLYKNELENIEKEINKNDSSDPIKIINDNTQHVELHIKSNQYLSDIRDDIIANLSHITLLEAGAGYGKTEMIKGLPGKIILILPFTSTIKAKVEKSEVTKDWLYYYGNKRPTLSDILGNQSLSMTIDKFSKLNVMELDQANFEYIVIDESHLLFTSSYRDVMSPTIQRLANCKAKIIMMTGTPTGELLFFPGIKHIKVIKEDYRQKEFAIHMFPTKHEKFVEMCKMMAKDIMDGKKILYPTNNGNLYYEQVTGYIQTWLDTWNYNHKLRSFYYKKSNFGDESMDNINFSKTVGNNDIIVCTTYLSVGVDICDPYSFSVYFSELRIAQDIEQFANRLRNNDLFVKILLEKEDSTGFPINYYYTQPLNLSFSQEDLLIARDLIKTCNDMLERNQEESKYNPLISSLLSANRYLKYDENDCKYYIDETTYKLRVFEERYSEYSKQLKVLIDGMKYYGYTVDTINHDERIPEENLELLEEYIKHCRHMRYDYITKQTFIFLDHLNDNNIDTYKDILHGSYEIFRNTEYKEKDKDVYVEDIEILERNLPIVVGLYKFYDCDTIKDIFKYCVDKKQNKLNYSKLTRIRKFVNIEYNIKRTRLDFPIYKFIKDAQQFAKNNTYVEASQITDFLANYAAKYANTIKNVVIEDSKFLETIFELISELWKVIIIQSRPKKGIITISPFELLWECKDNYQNIYGTIATKEFFLQELIDDMKDDNEDDVEDLPDLPMTEKQHLNEVVEELPSVIHDDYSYKVYSELDGSNKRFLRKQENTNYLNNVKSNQQNTENTKTDQQELALFDDVPF